MGKPGLALCIALVALAGCRSSSVWTPPPAPTSAAVVTAQDLIGVWRLIVLDLQFNQDGTFSLTKNYGLDSYPDYPVVTGEYKLEGDLLTLWDNGGFNNCKMTEVGSYRVQATTKDHLIFVLVHDPCEGRAGAMTMGMWRWALMGPQD